jgi:hypothetical protein
MNQEWQSGELRLCIDSSPRRPIQNEIVTKQMAGGGGRERERVRLIGLEKIPLLEFDGIQIDCRCGLSKEICFAYVGSQED